MRTSEMNSEGNLAAGEGRPFALHQTSGQKADLGGPWCPGAESNHRHADFQSAALPTELPGHARAEALLKARSGKMRAFFGEICAALTTAENVRTGEAGRARREGRRPPPWRPERRTDCVTPPRPADFVLARQGLAAPPGLPVWHNRPSASGPNPHRRNAASKKGGIPLPRACRRRGIWAHWQSRAYWVETSKSSRSSLT